MQVHLPLACLLLTLNDAPAPQSLAPTLQGGVELAWEAGWDSSASSEDGGVGVVVRGPRAYVASRTTTNAGAEQLTVIAYDSLGGAPLWTWQHAGEPLAQEGLAVSGNGRAVFVGGRGPASFLARLDAATGELDWLVSPAPGGYAGPEVELAAMALSHDGKRVLLHGAVRKPLQQLDGRFTLSIDAVTGFEQWEQVVDGTDRKHQPGSVLDGGSSGLVFAVGSSWDTALPESDLYATATFAATGQPAWTVELDAKDEGDRCFDAAYLPAGGAAGRLAIAGRGVNEGFVLAVDAATGAGLWSRNFDEGWARLETDATGSRLVHAVTADVLGFGYLVGVTSLEPATGAALWQTTLLGGASSAAGAARAALAPDGSAVFVTRNPEAGTGAGAYRTTALRADDGQELWSQGLMGFTGGSPADVAVDLGGGQVLVTGAASTPATGADATTVAYALPNGAERWVHAADQESPGVDQPRALALSSDGTRAFVAGATVGASTRSDLRAFDAASGQPLWRHEFSVGGAGLAVAEKLAVHPLQDIVFALVRGDESFSVAAYDGADGSELWSRLEPGETAEPSDDYELFESRVDLLAGQASGRLYATFPRNGNWATIAYDSLSGAVVWDVEFDHGVGDDQPGSLALSPDESRLFAAGVRWEDFAAFAAYAPIVVAYDAATGAELWRADGPGSNFAVKQRVVVAPDGGAVFVSMGPWTRAFDASSGALLWKTLFSARELVVSPDGTRLHLASTGADVAVLDTQTGSQLAALHASEFAELAFITGARLDPDGAVLFLSGCGGFSLFKPVCETAAVVALDATTLARLWHASIAEGGVGEGETCAASAEGRRIYQAAQFDPSHHPFESPYDGRLLAYDVPTLTGNPGTLTLVAGGAQALELRAGSEFGGALYWVLGTTAGTSPGLALGGGLMLPLNPSAYFDFTLFAAGAPPLTGALGVLDALGRASAAVTFPPSAGSSLAGVVLHHAALVLEFGGSFPEVRFASNAVAFVALP